MIFPDLFYFERFVLHCISVVICLVHFLMECYTASTIFVLLILMVS